MKRTYRQRHRHARRTAGGKPRRLAVEQLERRELLSVSFRSTLRHGAITERPTAETRTFEASSLKADSVSRLHPTSRPQNSQPWREVAERQPGRMPSPPLAGLHAMTRVYDRLFAELGRSAAQTRRESTHLRYPQANATAIDVLPTPVRPALTAWSSNGIGSVDGVPVLVPDLLVSRTIPTPNPPELSLAMDAFDRSDTQTDTTPSPSSHVERSDGFIDISPAPQAPVIWPLDPIGPQIHRRTRHTNRPASDLLELGDFELDDRDRPSHDSGEPHGDNTRNEQDANQTASDEPDRLASQLAPDPGIGGMIELSVYVDERNQTAVDIGPDSACAEQLVAAIEMDESCGVLQAFELATSRASNAAQDDDSAKPVPSRPLSTAPPHVLASAAVIDRTDPSAKRQDPSEGNRVTWRTVAAVSAGGLVLVGRRKRLHDYLLSKIEGQNLTKKK